MQRADHVEGAEIDKAVFPGSSADNIPDHVEIDVVIRHSRLFQEHAEHNRELIFLPGEQIEGKVLLQLQPLPDPFVINIYVRPFQHRDDVVVNGQLLFYAVFDVVPLNQVNPLVNIRFISHLLPQSVHRPE